MTPAGINITAPAINLVADGVITQTAASSSVNTSGPATITSASTVTIAGTVVKIN
jgi:hypothetical protein